jgi:hypothetical protein
MTMTSPFRKFALTAHVASSVGWLGAVASFSVLSIAGLISEDAEIVRGVYLAMNVIGQFMIVPLAFASLLTGLVVALGTQWGLFRHYWVLLKFVITIFATILLLMHMQPVRLLAHIVRETTLFSADVGRLQIQVVGDSGAALLALLVNVTLSVYKPRGMTMYGQRKQQELRKASRSFSAASPDRTRNTGDALEAELPSYADTSEDAGGTPRWVKVVGISAIVLVLLFKLLKIMATQRP